MVSRGIVPDGLGGGCPVGDAHRDEEHCELCFVRLVCPRMMGGAHAMTEAQEVVPGVPAGEVERDRRVPHQGECEWEE
jgi:hypothetical protein